MNATTPFRLKSPAADECPPPLNEELRKLGVRVGARDLPSVTQGRKHPQPAGIQDVIAGELFETPHGPCFVVEQRFPLTHLHGGQSLGSLLASGQPAPLLARLCGDERVSAQDFRSALFFDIETTGLGIGSGVCAFLVGTGAFEGDEFCLRQYFLRDYSEEEALLHLLDRQMQERGWWVSFNGRNFDLPILQARFVCARREMRLAQAPHLDLLHPARHLWRRRLGSCALSSLEAGVLGMPRQGDVPGWLIPELYFDYLRYGDTSYLPQVFAHNAQDVLSLVTLATCANASLCDPLGPNLEHVTDLYSLGVILAAQGQTGQAQRALERALERGLPPSLQVEALHQLSHLFKKAGRMDEACRIWHLLREKNEAKACVELAKDCEHRQRDHASAARWTCEALALSELPAKGECSRQALKLRLARLRKKVGGGLPMPHIASYAFGRIVVDDKTYTQDLILLPGGARPGWWRKEGHLLQPEDLQEVLEAKPSVLVVGTGNPGLMKVPQETLDYLAAQGIRVEVHPTAAACQRYNELARSEQAAAALHLTC